MNSRLRRTAAIYGERASDYLRYWAPALVELNAPLVAKLPSRLGVLVDIGAGVGALMNQLEPRARRSIGLDLTERMLREAKRVERIVADAERLPLRNAFADTAVSTFALQHIPRPANVYNQAARILKRGGIFATTTWAVAHDMDTPLYQGLSEALNEVGAPPTEGRKTWHHLVDDADKIARLATKAKLKPDAWVQRTSYRWPSAERFLGWAQGCGQFKGRFDGLDEHARRAALDIAAGTLARLAPDDFVWSPEIVYCIARR